MAELFLKGHVFPGIVIGVLEFFERWYKRLGRESSAIMPKITPCVRQLLNVIPPVTQALIDREMRTLRDSLLYHIKHRQ